MKVVATGAAMATESGRAGGHSVQPPHNLILEGRKHLTATGVTNVDSYDEQTIVAYTEEGQLLIRGRELHMEHLNTESGELTVTGEVLSLTYAESRQQGSFFSRLFR